MGSLICRINHYQITLVKQRGEISCPLYQGRNYLPCSVLYSYDMYQPEEESRSIHQSNAVFNGSYFNYTEGCQTIHKQ